MESLNPGGTGKDRAALYMLKALISNGQLVKNGIIVEGTSGSTGISLASLCQAMGFTLYLVMPDDQAEEKRKLLEALGAIIKIVPCCAISSPDHYVNTARRLATELGPKAIFLNQFENPSNFDAHYYGTGPELFIQTGGRLDAFVMSAGTGGTIAGISRYLKETLPEVMITLADPVGSSLAMRVNNGVCYTPLQAERSLRRHRYDSIVEGVGLDRVTLNFQNAIIDKAITVTDQEALDMAHWLLKNEGLFVGSSSALNIVAACQIARQMPSDSTIVTVVCDSGQRHISRFWNQTYIEAAGLTWPVTDFIPDCLRD